jgi:hypothetical protein
MKTTKRVSKVLTIGMLGMMLALGFGLIGCASSPPEGAAPLSGPHPELVGKTFVTADVTAKDWKGVVTTYYVVLEVNPADGSIKRGETPKGFYKIGGGNLTVGDTSKITWVKFDISYPGEISNVGDVASFNQGKIELANILKQ